MPQALPDLDFETAQVLKRHIGRHERQELQIIGRLRDQSLTGQPLGTPFLLHYLGDGVTSWWCPVTLGESQRRKILDRLRKQVRYAQDPPAYVTVHDLREQDQQDFDAACKRAEQLTMTFFEQTWQAVYLGQPPQTWVALAVPFAEKDAAKALGCRWNSLRRVWEAPRADDMSAFARWMPPQAAAAEPDRVRQREA